MAELETLDPGDGGKKGKKGKKGTVNGKKVETAPDGTKYTVKDGKKIAISMGNKKEIEPKKGMAELKMMQKNVLKPKEEPIRTSVSRPKDPDEAERAGEMKTTSGESVPNYRTKEGKEYYKQGGQKVFTKPSTAMGGESQKSKSQEDAYGTSVFKNPEYDAYKSEKTEETMKTVGGERVPLYRTKTGGEYIVQKGKKVMLKSSPTMTGGKL